MVKIFGEEYRKIIEEGNSSEDISEKVRTYVKNLLEELVKRWENLEEPEKRNASESIAGIPINLFSIENIKTDKKTKKVVERLIDMEGNKQMKNSDRFSIIKEVYSRLKNIE